MEVSAVNTCLLEDTTTTRTADKDLPDVAGFGSDHHPVDPRLRALRAKFFDLQLRLEKNNLEARNEALQAQLLQAQEDLITLQNEFKEMKEKCYSDLAELTQRYESRQALALEAEQRVICCEDLVRFYEEQRRLMTAHWKLQCQLKDERIRSLNLQLTEYTIDWQHLGSQQQTEASLSHEHQCLQDRHSALLAESERCKQTAGRLELELAEVRADVAQYAEQESESADANNTSDEACGQKPSLSSLKAKAAGLRGQLKLLQGWRVLGLPPSVLPSIMQHPHSCIWRDELDVREGQLERITAQLDHTMHALNAAQADLNAQRARHEDMKLRHANAEAELTEEEQRSLHGQRRCTSIQKTRTDLQQVLRMKGLLGPEAMLNFPSSSSQCGSGFRSIESSPRHGEDVASLTNSAALVVARRAPPSPQPSRWTSRDFATPTAAGGDASSSPLERGSDALGATEAFFQLDGMEPSS